MPDIMNFTVTRNGNVNLNNLPRYTISFQVVDSNRQSIIIRDFSGANAISFPGILTTLTAAERDELLETIARFLISKRLE